ncbi:MAG: hypothetical protein VZR36_08950 [Prevotella sp.]|nr:hypothetical protein [Prevotella sp.]
MTLDEAIQHAQEIADKGCDQCAKDHQQLAEWLTELKKRRDAEPWTIYDANDGDIVFYETHYDEIGYIIIFESLYRRNEYEPAEGINHYLLYCPEEKWFDQNIPMYVGYYDMDKFKQATEEQKQVLFDALEKYGYRWDAEAKKIIKI